MVVDLPEGSSHARKAARRQKREQRERERQRMERHQQHEFRLERKRPQSEHITPSSDVHHPASSISSSHSPYSNDPRLPTTANPQFAKWIFEQNVHYQTDRGSEIDLRSSRSSLTNFSEKDRQGSPSNGYASSYYQREMVSERGSYYRPSSPPVKDSAPSSRPTDYPYPSRYDGFGSATALDIQAMSAEPPTKFSEYTIPEMDEPVFHPQPVVGAPSVPSNGLGHKNAFSSLSSQMTVESQQMLTPYSQQQTPSQQQQQQHLDKLSMDVMLHTQLSGTSMQGGITSIIPKFNQSKTAKTMDGKPHLERADLKELEMDEIDLEKQRIQLMLYEQQKQERENTKVVEVADTRSEPVEVMEGVEKEEHCLSTEQLRQELESLDQIVSDQKKKYREIKMAREREEQNLKQAEKELFMECVNPNDQHQWHIEQKRRLREIEKLKSKQNERLQQIQYNEHRAKNKLKAIEAQAAVIRQQLQKAEAAAAIAAATATQNMPVDLNSRSPSQTKLHSVGGFKGGYDVFPTKMTSSDRQRGEERTVDHSNTIEWDIDGMKSVPAHAISFESMSTAITFDQPEIATELATTMSESVLTEPTQDDPAPTKWPPSGYGSRPVSGGLLPSDDFFSTKSHSRNTLITESDDLFLNRDERLRRDQPQSMVTVNAMENPLPSLRSMEERDFTHGQQITRGYPHQAGDEMQLAFRRTNRPTSNGALQNQAAPSHEQACCSGNKQACAEREVGRSQAAAANYDVPARARAVYQHHQLSSNRQQQQHGRHHRGRGTPIAARNTGMATTDLPSLDRPVQDAPRLVNGSSSGAPDVVPMSYSPVSPHHLTSPTQIPQQRQVTGSEMMMGEASVPPPRSPTSYPIYDVPPPSNERGRLPPVQPPLAPSSPVSTTSSSHPQDPASLNTLPHRTNINHHMTGHVSTSGTLPPSTPTADNIYDQPRSVMLRASHSFRSTTGTNGPVYDVPAAARRSVGYEGGITVPQQDSQLQSHLPNHPSADYSVHAARVGNSEKPVSNTQPTVPKSKHISSHRYGISKPGMGHSYSRGRPDLDKAKQYIDTRSYRNQGGARHPERIQRQQTDL